MALNGENTQSFLLPEDNTAQTVEVAELMPMPFPSAHPSMGAGQTTTSSLPQVGPPKGPVIGGIVGGFAAITIGMVVWAHHRANNYDFVVFDVGWQFQVVLDSPVTLDAAQVAAAAAAPTAN